MTEDAIHHALIPPPIPAPARGLPELPAPPMASLCVSVSRLAVKVVPPPRSQPSVVIDPWFIWEDDRRLRVPWHDTVIYEVHVKGFTHRHPSIPPDLRGREALACAVFRAAGIPAPRTAYAEVTLTVPGKYDREHLGLYTVVEPVDRAFIRDRFKTDRVNVQDDYNPI